MRTGLKCEPCGGLISSTTSGGRCPELLILARVWRMRRWSLLKWANNRKKKQARIRARDAVRWRSRGVCTTIPRNKLNVVSPSTSIRIRTIILLIKQHFTWSFHSSVVTTSESLTPGHSTKTFELACWVGGSETKEKNPAGRSFPVKISISWSFMSEFSWLETSPSRNQ